MMFSAILIATVLSLTVGQNLVLIGGNLRDDNTQVWNKMVELAVSLFTIFYYQRFQMFNGYRVDEEWRKLE